MDSIKIEKNLRSVLALYQQSNVDSERSGENFSIESHWLFKVLGWSGLLISPGFAIWGIAVSADFLPDGGIRIFMVAALGGLLLFLARSAIYFHSGAIIYVNSFGCFQINWDEIEKITFDKKVSRIAFYSSDKWLVLPQQHVFVSGNQTGLAEYIKNQIKTRQIPVEIQPSMPKQSKGVKVW